MYKKYFKLPTTYYLSLSLHILQSIIFNENNIVKRWITCFQKFLIIKYLSYYIFIFKIFYNSLRKFISFFN